MRAYFWVLLIPAFLISLSCTRRNESASVAPVVNLRAMTPDEARKDFQEMADYFRTLYGPMEYKEARLGFSYEQWVNEIDAKLQTVKSDDETFGLYAQFVSRFQDGHVGISFSINNTQTVSYSVPIFIAPIANAYVIADVSKELTTTAIAKGDEVVSIDGKTPDELLPLILKYHRLATAESDRHLIFKALNRDFYMTDLKPARTTVELTVRKPDGKLITETFPWKLTPWAKERFVENQKLAAFSVPAMSDFQAASGASLLTMSRPVPFFATDEVAREYGFRVVTANEEFRKKYELKETDKPKIFAALYKFQGKTILLVRNYVYSHSDFDDATYMKGYKAILDQWEGMADVLVLDQTHNGGGAYCEEFARLFIQEQKDGFVQQLNVDRKWIHDLTTAWPQFVEGAIGRPVDGASYHAMGAVVEAAYDRGDKLTRPLPIIGGRIKITPLEYTWKKPMLVLIDELAGSCGDAFPMLIKHNQVAKLFGQRTMGLGGNVEGFTLTHSQTSVHLTRGLFTIHRDDDKYLQELFIENNGVQPDYNYQHTVEDFRKGFTGYVKAFSEKALAQIP